jgi:hypothetical protein
MPRLRPRGSRVRESYLYFFFFDSGGVEGGVSEVPYNSAYHNQRHNDHDCYSPCHLGNNSPPQTTGQAEHLAGVDARPQSYQKKKNRDLSKIEQYPAPYARYSRCSVAL